MYVDLNKKARTDSRVDKLIELTARQSAALLELDAKVDALPRPVPPPPVVIPNVIDYTSAIDAVAKTVPDIAPLSAALDFVVDAVAALRLRVRALESVPPVEPYIAPPLVKVKSYTLHLSVGLAVNFSLLAYLIFRSF